uniref:Uncharacterized protein n=1 Tax=Panagrolaimus sp. ES5 TaxID=591445 RepID=A0AC34GFK7_9BILA
QETMRNLIEQHSIVDNDLTTVRQVRESPRSSQEKSFKALSEEAANISTDVFKGADSQTISISRSDSFTEKMSKSLEASKIHSIEKDIEMQRHEGVAAPETASLSHIIGLTEKTSLVSEAPKEVETMVSMEMKLAEEFGNVQSTVMHGNEAIIAAKTPESQETMRNLIEQHSVYDSDHAIATALPVQTHSKFQRTFSDETTSISTDFSSALSPSISIALTQPEPPLLISHEQGFGIDEITSDVDLMHKLDKTSDISSIFASSLHDKASSTFLQQSNETSNNDVVLMRVPKPLSESQFESTIAEGRKIEESLATQAATEEEAGNGY